ncbi:MAG TPA: hypothetical protein VH331_17775 [Allosphingosinicella sp.]|nr:hypothetical protein [Allosphingosinicella sp.]
MSATLELLSGILMGLALAALGAVIGFTAPTEAEAAADPESLRWGRRPAIRRRLGFVIIALGILIAGLRVARVLMR